VRDEALLREPVPRSIARDPERFAVALTVLRDFAHDPSIRPVAAAAASASAAASLRLPLPLPVPLRLPLPLPA